MAQVEKGDLVKEWERLLLCISDMAICELHDVKNIEAILDQVEFFFHEHADSKVIFCTPQLIEEVLFYKVDLFSKTISFYTRHGLVIQFTVVYPSFKTDPPRPRVNIYSLHAPLE